MRQIWNIYDRQFNELRQAVMSLGDKVVTETFTGTGSKILKTEHTYSRNHVMVYWNNLIQWKGVDYTETDCQTITFLHDISSKDVIRVVIVLNDMMFTENLLNIEHIRECVEENLPSIVEDKLERLVDVRVNQVLESLLSQIVEDQLPDVVGAKIAPILEEKLTELLDTQFDDLITEKVNEVVENEIKTFVDGEIEDYLALHDFSDD